MTDVHILTQDKLKSLSHNELVNFLEENFNSLVGGQIFSIGHTKYARLIQFITRRDAHSKFVPTHTGQIVNITNRLFVINVAPPTVTYMELEKYIENTDEDFRLVYRGKNFQLDTAKYSYELSNLVGKEYGWFSAIQSGLKLLHWIPNKKLHCSEATVKFLKEQGYFKGVKADDVTPAKLWYLMSRGKF